MTELKQEIYLRLKTFLANSQEQQGMQWDTFVGLLTSAMELVEPPDATLDRLRREVEDLDRDDRTRIAVIMYSLTSLISDPIAGESWRRAIALVHAEMQCAPERATSLTVALVTEGTGKPVASEPRGDDNQLERTPNTNTD